MGSCPIGTNFGSRPRIHLGMDIGKYKSPLNTQRVFGGGGVSVTNSKVWGRCQTAGPIGTTFGTHLQIHMGMDIRQTNCPSRQKAALGGGGLGVKHSKVLGSCQTAGPIGTNFGSRLRIHLGMDIG